MASGCTDWDAPIACAGSHDVCSGGACTATCSDQCTLGAAMCSGTGVATCRTMASGCTDWDAPAACTRAHEVCSGGACTATCSDQCAPGATRCSGTGVATCKTMAPGCTDWDTPAACTRAHEVCSGGACTATCSDQCTLGAAMCSGTGVATCRTMASGCTDWDTPAACADVREVCSGNHCVCLPETDAAFCARLGADCDPVTAGDNCGAQRSVDCGACAAGESCGLTTPNVCGAPVAPQITGFTVSPSLVSPGLFTDATWTWSYASAPVPAPICSITSAANDIGTITSGETRNIDLTGDTTTFTLTCSNAAGTDTAETAIHVAPPPVNDTCDNATPLTLGSSATTVRGSTLGASPTDRLLSRDVWYKVTISQNTVFYVNNYGMPPGSGVGSELFDGSCAALHRRTPRTLNNFCNDQEGSYAHELPPGTYYLRAWTSLENQNDFSLDIETLPWEFDVQVGATSRFVLGTVETEFGAPQVFGTCGGREGRGTLVYWIQCKTTPARTVSASLCQTVDPFGSALYVRSGVTGAQLACASAQGCQRFPTSLSALSAALPAGPGLFGVYIDGSRTSDRGFHLDLAF